jgi:putative tricarboxylic transport membrane protein
MCVDLPELLTAFAHLLTTPAMLGYLALGVVIGIIFGALPGLTAITGLALLLPITFRMDPVTALGMLVGAYVGGIAGVRRDSP